MIKNIAGIFVLIFMAGQVAEAEDNEKPPSAPLSMIFYKYDDYLKLSEEGEPRFRLYYQMSSKLVSSDELVFRFKHDGKDIVFSPKKDGTFDYMPTAAMLEADPLVFFNQPNGTLNLALSMEIILPFDKVQDIKTLHDQTHLAWKQAKNYASAFSFFAPKHSPITALFDESCDSKKWMIKSNGRVMAEGSGEDGALIDFSEKKIRKAQSVTFSCAPVRFLLGEQEG